MNPFTSFNVGDIVETTEEFRKIMEKYNEENKAECIDGCGFYYYVPYYSGKITDIEIKWINEPEYSVKGFLVLATLENKIGQIHVKWLELKEAI
jgi:hypothetical protein